MKPSSSHIKNDTVTCAHCITGETENLSFRNNTLVSVIKADKNESQLHSSDSTPLSGQDLNENPHLSAPPFFSGSDANKSQPLSTPTLFSGPGLVDLQINGICGIDFNAPSLTVEAIIDAAHYLLSKGITTFFPTVITHSDEHIIAIMRILAAACKKDPLVSACVGGIHLEGPFISPHPGARGAHSRAFIKPPDWELFCRFQEAAEGGIKIITLAPEWEGASEFIEKCRRSDVIVSIGHSLANTAQIKDAVKAGARMSTHLGNGIPLLLPRHPNTIWDQLAEDDLYTCIIADGIHIPDSFIKVVRKTKANAALLISDATCFAGMTPGEYQSHIGGAVVLDKNGRLSMKEEPGLLAGAARSLSENIETLLEHRLCSLGDAWQMASTNVARFLHACGRGLRNYEDDRVVFTVEGTSVQVQKVIKNGKLAFSK